MKSTFVPNVPQGGQRAPREPQRKHRINHEIKVNEVRVIDQEGKMLGVLTRNEALRMAEEREVDLVEIAPQANPPVCRIIDYGKFVYELAKKEKALKKNQATTLLKEIRFKWRTATHDFNFKVKHARSFIEEGNKVKASVMFRGREITHQEIGKELLEKFIEAMKDIAKLDQPLKMEGKNLSVILSPEKTKGKAIPTKSEISAEKAPKAPKETKEVKL